jgi:sortase (surface protein transpeptidase)
MGYHRGMPRLTASLTVVVALLLTACGPRFDVDAVVGPPAQQMEATATSDRTAAGGVAPPAELAIPAIGVRSPLIDLGLEPDRTVEVPEDPDLAGWYTGGPKPGQTGPATIIGHVDSWEGAGIFHRLHELTPGDEVAVRTADGSVVRFAVDHVEQHPKDDFPTATVYGDTEGPELRLITCGGDFDRSARSYRENVIVFASRVG